jgi:hypothetical protein
MVKLSNRGFLRFPKTLSPTVNLESRLLFSNVYPKICLLWPLNPFYFDRFPRKVGSALANALVVPPVFPNGDVIAVSPTDRKCHKFDGRFGMRNEPNAVQDRSALRRIFRAIRCYLRRFAQGVDHIKVLGVRRIVDGQSRARAWPGRSGAAAFSPCRVRRNRNEPARPREGDILCESGGRRR